MLRARNITKLEYKETAGFLYNDEIFPPGDDDSTTLPAQAIELGHALSYDVFVSHDWGRELGLDNHKRVIDACSQLTEAHLRVCLDHNGQVNDDSMCEGVNRSGCALVFITRRYVRRIQEKHYINDEYQHMLQRLGLARMIFVVMEQRMDNTAKWAADLGIPTDMVDKLCISKAHVVKDNDMLSAPDLFARIKEINKTTLRLLIKRMFSMSYENIFKAISMHETPAVVEFISYATSVLGLDVFSVNNTEGNSILYCVCEAGNAQLLSHILSLLLLEPRKEKLRYINHANREGCTALFIAASCGHLECVQKLIAAGANVDQYNAACQSVIYAAAQHSHSDIVDALIDAKADINIADTNGLVPADITTDITIATRLQKLNSIHKEFLSIAKRGVVSEFHELYRLNPQLNINFENEDGRTALFLAVCDNRAEMVEALLAAGADVTVADNWEENVLHCACLYAKDTRIVNMLLDTKAIDINARNVWGHSPLTYNLSPRASSHLEGPSPIVAALIASGANVSISDSGDEEGEMTPLNIAFSQDRYADILQLLEAGAVLGGRLAEKMLSKYPFFFRVATSAGNGSTTEAAVSAADGSGSSSGGWGNGVVGGVGGAGGLESSGSSKKHSAAEDVPSSSGTPAAVGSGGGDHAGPADSAAAAASALAVGSRALAHTHSRKHSGSLVAEQVQHVHAGPFFTYKALSVNDFAVWFTLLQTQPTTSAEDAALQQFVLAQVILYPSLASAKDVHGRIAVDVATKANKLAINAHFLWHGRYRILDQHPEHVSATCYVYRALDENTLDETGNPIKVALKLMRFKSHFIREVASRRHNFDPSHVVTILCTYPATSQAQSGMVDGDGNDAKSTCEDTNKDTGAASMVPDELRLEQLLQNQPEDCFAVDIERRGGGQPASANSAPGSRPASASARARLAAVASGVAASHQHSAYSETDSALQELMLDLEDQAANTAALTKLRNGETVRQLTRFEAELMYCIVMPLADRNMFVCLKQERFAGKVENLDEIAYVFQQLVKCVEHMHSKGVLHADLKTLNIVRSGINWQLIDLDAACVIGEGHVGIKFSSAYVPPEAVFVNKYHTCAMVKSPDNAKAWNAMVQQQESENENEREREKPMELVRAHPSFDVWSLGCILYQLCTADVRPLFQAGQDDNLSDNISDADDNLFVLAEWSDALKARKLSRVIHPMARNLLAQMLHKDPLKRPTLERILSHTFVSKKQFTRLVGQPPLFDVFLSYRVASDTEHVRLLYDLLTAAGMKVWLDTECLKAGVNWETGFCSGLVSSRYFVCVISKDGINKANVDRQNFGRLTETSACDNVFLEYRLALELMELGLIEKIFPVFIGDRVVEKDSSNEKDGAPSAVKYVNFFTSNGLPASVPQVRVSEVERLVALHMEELGLGSPILDQKNTTVAAVLSAMLKFQGFKIEGAASEAFPKAVSYLLADYHATQLQQQQQQLKLEHPLKMGGSGGGGGVGSSTPSPLPYTPGTATAAGAGAAGTASAIGSSKGKIGAAPSAAAAATTAAASLPATPASASTSTSTVLQIRSIVRSQSTGDDVATGGTGGDIVAGTGAEVGPGVPGVRTLAELEEEARWLDAEARRLQARIAANEALRHQLLAAAAAMIPTGKDV
jgi:serine/threonine protein kinase/ankyrin repeat protein